MAVPASAILSTVISCTCRIWPSRPTSAARASPLASISVYVVTVRSTADVSTSRLMVSGVMPRTTITTSTPTIMQLSSRPRRPLPSPRRATTTRAGQRRSLPVRLRRCTRSTRMPISPTCTCSPRRRQPHKMLRPRRVVSTSGS